MMKKMMAAIAVAVGMLTGCGIAHADPTPTPPTLPYQKSYDEAPCGASINTAGPMPFIQFKPCPTPGSAP